MQKQGKNPRKVASMPVEQVTTEERLREAGIKAIPKRVPPERFREVTSEWPDTVSGCTVVAKTLAEEGLSVGFSVFGWDYMWGWTRFGQVGQTIYHHRHDQTPAWAAGGYAVGKCKPGYAIVDRRPGASNLHPGLAWAHGTRTPMVVLCSSAPLTWMERGGGQEYNVDRLLGSFWDGVCKWAHRCINIHDIAYWIRKAHRDCIREPRGPCVVQIPSDLLIGRVDHRHEPQLYDWAYGLGEKRPAEIRQGGGDPEDIEKAVEILLNAERPVIISGSALYWSEAWEELKELVELLQVPVLCRRYSRGCIPEDHPLHFHGGPRGVAYAEADVILVMGLELNFLEFFGQPPVWNPHAKYIMVQEDASMHFSTGSPPGKIEASILGNTKQVLKQMLEVAKTKVTPQAVQRWQPFVSHLRDVKDKYFVAVAERVKKLWEKNPCDGCHSPCSALEDYLKTGAVDWEVLAYEIAQVMDKDSSMIIDSFSMSDVCTNKFFARHAGAVLDCGIHMGVGHSLGIGIGLQVARPGTQTVGFAGDSGFGIAAMELETMVRYNLPHVTVLCNNHAWGGRSCIETGFYLRPWTEVSWQNWPGFIIPYHEMFAPLRVHTEFVTHSSQVRPAIERAFNSGKPALIHALGDCSATPALIVILGIYQAWSEGLKRSDFATGIAEELGKAGPGVTVATLVYLYGYGLNPKLDELCEITGADKKQCEDILRAHGIPYK